MTPLRDRIWRGARAERLRASLVLGPGVQVADLGCGRGELGAVLASSGATVHGFDADPEQIEAGRARRVAGLRFVEADARSVPVDDGAFDRVVCQALLVHQGHPEDVVAEMVRLVRPGGLVAALEPLPPVFGDDALGELRSARWAAAARRAREAGLGSWRVGQELEERFAAAGIEPVDAWVEDGGWRLEPGDDALRDLLLELARGEAAEAETLRWLAEEAGLERARLDALDRLEAEERQRRLAELRRGQRSEEGSYPLAVFVGRRPASV